MTNVKFDLDKILREIKKTTGLTQEEIADRIGYDRSYLSQAKKAGSEKLYGVLMKEFGDNIKKYNKSNITSKPSEVAATDSETGQALLNLTESTKRLSESNLINARNIERLITLMETNSYAAAGKSLAEDPALGHLVRLMAKIAAGKRWGSEQEFVTEAVREVQIPSLEGVK